MPVIPQPAASSLLFRLPTSTDAAALQPILDDPVVRAAMRWPGQHTDADTWVKMQLQMYEARGPFQVTSEVYPFAIALCTDGTLVGFALVRISFEDRTVLTGELNLLFFAESHRREDHGSEALSALVDWAFDDVIVEGFGQRGSLRQVLAVCNTDNTAAVRLLRKYLIDEGVVDSNPDEQGQVTPVHRFRLTREQHSERKSGQMGPRPDESS
jgi:RimJ/RimL family protein N-acetyltransferase